MSWVQIAWTSLLVVRHTDSVHVHRTCRILVLPPERDGERVCSLFLFLLLSDCLLWGFRRHIRLPGDGGPYYGGSNGGVMETIASVPWFVVGVAGIAWEWIVSHVESAGTAFRTRRGYRNIPVDEDAQILRFEDEH